MFEFPPRSYTCRVCTGALPRPHHLLMAHSVREALHISFLLLILVRMLLAALEAVSAAMVLLQTIPHFQQSGEVFADARLTACIALAPRMDRAWVKTFSSSSSSLRSQSSALIRALASAFLPLLHVPGTAGAVLQKMTKR